MSAIIHKSWGSAHIRNNHSFAPPTYQPQFQNYNRPWDYWSTGLDCNILDNPNNVPPDVSYTGLLCCMGPVNPPLAGTGLCTLDFPGAPHSHRPGAIIKVVPVSRMAGDQSVRGQVPVPGRASTRTPRTVSWLTCLGFTSALGRICVSQPA